MKLRYLLAALALTIATTDSMAGPWRRRAQPAYQPTYQPVYQPSSQSLPYLPSADGYVSYYAPTAAIPAAAAVPTSVPMEFSGTGPAAAGMSAGSDGLDEVNAKRAARGLRPFIRDEGLTQAAQACATFRAQHRLFGHTSNDFGFVPPGTSASSAGCAAYPAGYGWMSCCVYDNYTYAGAAWAMGSDGQRYMHLFVR